MLHSDKQLFGTSLFHLFTNIEFEKEEQLVALCVCTHLCQQLGDKIVLFL